MENVLDLYKNAKQILEDGEYSVDSINVLLRFFAESFNLSCVCIRQRISRPYSLRIMYEYIKYSPTKRINQTITYSSDDWNHAIAEYKKGPYVYYYDENEEPMPGVIRQFKPLGILQIPYFSNGIFMGTLDFIDFQVERRWLQNDMNIYKELCNITFEALAKLDEEIVSPIMEDEKDYITGLSRYESFIENLDRIIPDCTQNNDSVLLIYADIHHFKLINETYGYRKGDELLRTYSKLIRSGRSYIDACRVHSDNFIVAYPLHHEEAEDIVENIEAEQKWIALQLRETCPDSHIRICCGIYVLDNNSIDAATAVAYANMARKRSKEHKGHHAVVFSEDMISNMKWQAYLNNELPHAMENKNLIVYYQPKISCTTGRLFGAEALIRWQKEDGSFIYPDQFIPEFESNGNIITLDYYVFEEVFRYLRRRLDMELTVVPISMNVSRMHLENNDIIPFIRSLLEKYEIPTKYIEFELTENIYMQNIEPAKKFVEECNRLGISVSMDDFGSGYSSLNMISSLKIDILKIDKIFMKHESLSENDRIVLSSVIEMAKQLHMMVLCEGVESAEQVEFLKEAGCDIIQGYYYGKPMPQKEFDLFIAQNF